MIWLERMMDDLMFWSVLYPVLSTYHYNSLLMCSRMGSLVPEAFLRWNK